MRPPEPSAPLDFSVSPVTAAWEVTRACPLACVHCRASARTKRDSDELTTEEGFRLIDGIARLGVRVLVITGGDPLARGDVFELIAYGADRGLRVGFSPSVTPRLTEANLARAKQAGITMLHISLDGPTAEVHDRFRGVRGSFARTQRVLSAAKDLGIALQVATTVAKQTAPHLSATASFLESFEVAMWSLFFLVPTGRAQRADMLSAVEHEAIYRQLFARSKNAPYAIRTTSAPAYRRVVLQARAGENQALSPVPRYLFLDREPYRRNGMNDGNGFVFVSDRGGVFPSGFLPLQAGHVRERSIVEIYRNSPLFRSLRDPDRLKGKCGVCPYRMVCGGSRARAFCLTGDVLASEPTCAYLPPALRRADGGEDGSGGSRGPTSR